MRAWSEGDAWTVGVGLAIALVLAGTTIPAALEDRPRPAAAVSAPVPEPVVVVPVPTPTAAAPAPGPSPSTQPLLGPLLPSPAAPAPAPTPTVVVPAVPYLAPGDVRRLAALPAGRPAAVAAEPLGTIAVGTVTKLHLLSSRGRLRESVDVPKQTTGLTALDHLSDGSLVAADAGRVLRYDGQWSVLAQVPDLVACVLPTGTSCQPGLEDTPPLLRGIVVDAAGTVFAADAGQGTVWRLPAGEPIEIWYQSADVAGDDGLAGMAFDADGHLLVTVTSIADLTGPAPGALLRIERAADGSAGTRTVVTAFKAGEDPVDVAIGTSGRAYVPLRGAHAVVVLDRQGVEVLRVVHDLVKTPTAVALQVGRVLVTTAALLEVGVLDRPLPSTPEEDRHE